MNKYGHYVGWCVINKEIYRFEKKYFLGLISGIEKCAYFSIPEISPRKYFSKRHILGKNDP